MKAELLNAFVSPTVEVFKNFDYPSVEIKDISSITSYHIATSQYVAVIGISGDLLGAVLLVLDSSTAATVASKVVRDAIEVDDEELVKDGVGEMANLIAGHATAKLEAIGKTVQISPPTIVSGAGVDYDFPADALNALIPFHVSDINFEMIVSFRR